MSGDSSKLHEMNPRKHRAASHKAGGGVREPHALRRHPSPRLAPHLARNTQTKYPGMARFARRA